MSLHPVRFPTNISLGSTGGPERRTEIVALASGHEERNTPWAQSRRRYDAGYGLRSRADLETVIAFFEARRGRLYGFLWRDPLDHSSAPAGASPGPLDQPLGTGDGTTTRFTLTKSYASGGVTQIRPITHPLPETLRIAIDGAETTAFTFDPASAEIVFDTAPATGTPLAAGYLFDVPARFDTDTLAINLASFDAGEIPSIPIVELRV
ncbi:MAG: DUF2460 domain-containing protein [Neomegalonema sp.]|nr:DUF2460 domain-containing protein [Neomegalonema sp.]